MQKFIVLLSLIVFTAGSAFSQDEDSSSSKSPLERLNLSVAGNGYMMFGQLVSGYQYAIKEETYVQHRWQNFYSARLDITTNPVDWFYTTLALEIASDFPVTQASVIQKSTYRLKNKCVIPKAVGVFDFKFPAWALLIETGLMEYNFAPENKNLGNYLYRTVAYPMFFDNEIDYVYANLMGSRLEAKFLEDNLRIEAILESEIKHAPFFDFSLGFTASVSTPNKFLDFGMGICFDRLFSVDKSLTDVVDKKADLTLPDSTILTYRAQKMDFRLSFDFKTLFGSPEFMGDEDLKLYSELGVIGLKDPQYFPEDSLLKHTMLNRMPILFGLNVPAFKILDLLSFEFEYCNYPFSFDWWGYPGPAPKPNYVAEQDTFWRENYLNEDNLRWTIYAKKSFSNFDIKLIFSKDHFLYNTASLEAQANYEQSLRTKKDWHWYLKLQYNL